MIKTNFKPFYPEDCIIIIWNIVIVVFLILTGIITPFSVCFIDEYDADVYRKFLTIEIVFDVIFGVDIIINFISAYYDKNNYLINSFNKIIINYLTGWFFIDSIAL